MLICVIVFQKHSLIYVAFTIKKNNQKTIVLSTNQFSDFTLIKRYKQHAATKNKI